MKTKKPTSNRPYGLALNHTVSVRLSSSELAQLEDTATKTKRSMACVLRAQHLGAKLPPAVPAVNWDALLELARIGSSLNQYIRKVNLGDLTPPNFDVNLLLPAMLDLRAGLLGVEK